MYEYRAALIKVVDGDTMHFEVDLGCDIRTQMTVRLYGLNCPEMSTPEGRTAKEFAVQWFADNVDSNGYFILQTRKDQKEKYGRYLGILLGTSGKNLNDELVASGHAVVYFP